MNPLVPTALDGASMIVSLGALILTLTALISLARSGRGSDWCFLAWAFAILFVPIAGPAAWFIIRRHERSVDPPHEDIG